MFSLDATIPFLNYIWRTDVFEFTGDPTPKPISDKVKTFLENHGQLEAYDGAIQNLAEQVDKFVPRLAEPKMRKKLGLASKAEVVGDGYALTGKASGSFLDIFVTCTVLDRILASQVSSPIRVRQSIHPLSTPVSTLELSEDQDYSERLRFLQLLAAAYDTVAITEKPADWTDTATSSGEGDLDVPNVDDPAVRHSTNLAMLATYSGSQAYLATVVCHIYLMANVILLLANGRKPAFAKSVLNHIRVSLPDGPFRRHAETLFRRLRFRELHRAYSAITGSILDILDPAWYNYKPYENRREGVGLYLKRTSRMQHEIPALVLRAESTLWRIIFSVIHDQTTTQLTWSDMQTLVQSQAVAGLRNLIHEYTANQGMEPVIVIRGEVPALPQWPPVPIQEWDEENTDDAEFPQDHPPDAPGKRPLSEDEDYMDAEPAQKRTKVQDAASNSPDSTGSDIVIAPGAGALEATMLFLTEGEAETNGELHGDDVPGSPPPTPPAALLGDDDNHDQDMVEDEGGDPQEDGKQQTTVQMDDEERQDEDKDEDMAGATEEDEEQQIQVHRDNNHEESEYEKGKDDEEDDDDDEEEAEERNTARRRKSKRLANQKGRKPSYAVGSAGRRGKTTKWRRTSTDEDQTVTVFRRTAFAHPRELVEDEKGLMALLDKTLEETKEEISIENERHPRLFSGLGSMKVQRHHMTIRTVECDENGSLKVEMVEFATRWYIGTPNDYASLRDLLEMTGLLEQSEPTRPDGEQPGCAVYTESALKTLNAEQLDKLFASQDIHVVPDHAARNRRQGGFPDKGFTPDTCEPLEIDLNADRQFHENRHLLSEDVLQVAQMRVGRLNDLFQVSALDARRVDVNCLDIRLPDGLTKMPALVRRMSIIHRTALIGSHTSVDGKFAAWALVSTTPARSLAHIDAGRFSAWIHVLAGTKIFFIRDDEVASTPSEPCATDPTKHRWVPVVLRPGHKLLLRPGREHLVYTMEDCIARGGHFYTHRTLYRSFLAGIRESLHGRLSTNDIQPTAETILQRLIQSYCQEVMELARKGPNASASFPVDRNLAALIVMNLYPDHLEPQSTLLEADEDEEAQGLEEEDWEFKRKQSLDRRNGYNCAIRIMANLREVLPDVKALAKELTELKKGVDAPAATDVVEESS